MSDNIFFAAFFFPAVAAVIIFSIKYGSAVLQAKVRLAQDQAYREIAAKAADAQADTVAALTSLRDTLAAMEARFTTLEKILTEVG